MLYAIEIKKIDEQKAEASVVIKMQVDNKNQEEIKDVLAQFINAYAA